MTSPARKRGPIPRISRESVLDAARQLPPSQLTMTAIAAELGVTAGALYRYFPDRARVLEALALERQALLAPPDATLGWREWLHEEIRRELALWGSHPELMEGAAMAMLAAPATSVIEVGLDVLTRDGFTPEAAFEALASASILAFGVNKMLEARRVVTQEREEETPAVQRLGELGVVIDLEGMSDRIIEITLDGLEALRRRSAVS